MEVSKLPVLRQHINLDLKRGLRAFLNFEAGVIRNQNATVSGPQSETRSQNFDGLSASSSGQYGAGSNKRAGVRNAASPESVPPRRSRARSSSELFRTLLKPLDRGRLLDLGCGGGEFSLAARDAGWQVIAVDESAVHMPAAPGITWVRAKLRGFEISDYECVSLIGALRRLELSDQLELLGRCAGAPTIIEAEASVKPNYKERGYRGQREEFAGPGQREQAELHSGCSVFWPTAESLQRMARDSGFGSVSKLEQGLAPERSFYLCV